MSKSIEAMSGDWKTHIEAWKDSLHVPATEGIYTVCYNFMPLLDWTRTNPRWETPNGAHAMRSLSLSSAAHSLSPRSGSSNIARGFVSVMSSHHIAFRLTALRRRADVVSSPACRIVSARRPVDDCAELELAECGFVDRHARLSRGAKKLRPPHRSRNLRLCCAGLLSTQIDMHLRTACCQ